MSSKASSKHANQQSARSSPRRGGASGGGGQRDDDSLQHRGTSSQCGLSSFDIDVDIALISGHHPPRDLNESVQCIRRWAIMYRFDEGAGKFHWRKGIVMGPAVDAAGAALPPPLPPPSPPLLPMDEGDGAAQGQGPGPLPPPEAVPMAGAVELAPVDPPAHTCASDRHRQRLAVQAVPPESDAATDRRKAGRAKGSSERACEGEPAEKKALHSGSRGCAAAGCSF